MKASSVVVFACVVGVTLATYGVDVSQGVSQSAYSCMINNGYSFAIVRVIWRKKP
jgi:hypothetical protein